jgi:hypothetical protein
LQVKAAVRTFNPREQKHMKPEPKFKIMVGDATVLTAVQSIGNAKLTLFVSNVIVQFFRKTISS